MISSLIKPILKPIALRKLNNGVPFAKNCGVRVNYFNEGYAKASMQSQSNLLTEQGALEAGAIFTLAETASGAAMTGSLLSVIISARPVVASSEFSVLENYAGNVIAEAKVLTDTGELLQSLKKDKKVTFPVMVNVTPENEETVIATMKAVWHVKL